MRKLMKTTTNRTNCYDCGEPIVWGMPVSTGNGNVEETFYIDSLKVIERSFEGGHTYALHKNNQVFATVCRPCKMTKNKKTN